MGFIVFLLLLLWAVITHWKLHPVLMFENLLPWSYSLAQRRVLLHTVLQEKRMVKIKLKNPWLIIENEKNVFEIQHRVECNALLWLPLFSKEQAPFILCFLFGGNCSTYKRFCCLLASGHLSKIQVDINSTEQMRFPWRLLEDFTSPF